MKRPPPVIVFLILLIPAAMLSPRDARAWTHAADVRIARKSVALAPVDMKLVLDHFSDEYNRGLEEAEADEASGTHHFVLSRNGRLRQKIETETSGIIKMIRTNQPMAEVAEHLGELVHLVADANNPFHASHDDARLDVMNDDFEQYFERRMAHFPPVFYGLDPEFRVSSFLDKTLTRTSKFYPLMGEEYFRDGDPHTSAEFDDHSTAFGVASICYSHAITDTVNLYYYIWREAGGNVLSKPPARRSNSSQHAN